MIARVLAPGSVWGLGAIVFARLLQPSLDTLKLTDCLHHLKKVLARWLLWVQEM